MANANGTQLYVAADTLDHLTVGRPPPAPRLPSNAFSFGKLKLNKRRGTAALLVRVPGPAASCSPEQASRRSSRQGVPPPSSHSN